MSQIIVSNYAQINVLSKVKILTGNTSQPTDCVFWNFNVFISIQSWEQKGKKRNEKNKQLIVHLGILLFLPRHKIQLIEP